MKQILSRNTFSNFFSKKCEASLSDVNLVNFRELIFNDIGEKTRFLAFLGISLLQTFLLFLNSSEVTLGCWCLLETFGNFFVDEFKDRIIFFTGEHQLNLFLNQTI